MEITDKITEKDENGEVGELYPGDNILKTLKGDLNDYSEDALKILNATYEPDPKKVHKSVASYSSDITFSLPLVGVTEGKDIYAANTTFELALKAYACFKASRDESKGKTVQRIFFDVGLSYFLEWDAVRKAKLDSIKYYTTSVDRKTSEAENKGRQSAIIAELLKNPDITAVQLIKNIEQPGKIELPQKTASQEIKKIKAYNIKNK